MFEKLWVGTLSISLEGTALHKDAYHWTGAGVNVPALHTFFFFSPEKTERNKQQVGVRALSWLPSLVVQIWHGSVLESCFLNAEEEPDRPCSTPQSILSFVIMFLPVRQLNWEAVASLSPDISVYLLYVIATKFCSSQYHIFRLLSSDYRPESSLFHSNSIIPVSVAVLQVFVIHNNFSVFFNMSLSC